MKTLRGRYLIAFFLLVATAYVVNLLQYDRFYNDAAAVETIKRIPLRIGHWTGHDIHLDERIYDILDTNAIVHRTYISDEGKDVFLSIVHYADTKVDFHAPEGCLGGRGVVAEKTTRTITLFCNGEKRNLNVAEIITNGSGGKTLVYYFYKVGKFSGQNYIKMRMNVALNKLTRSDTRGSLVRVSTQINSEIKADVSAVLISFINEIFPTIEEIL